jgi:predicted RNA-binding protein with PIN domain
VRADSVSIDADGTRFQFERAIAACIRQVRGAKQKMSLIIDGYNLLHVTGIFGRGQGPGGFDRSRRALLNFLAESIDPRELPRTTVVFDAAEAPPGLPRKLKHGPMTVHYATEYGSADALIELLVSKHSSPKRLVVVSSDHRLHRAARRRRATAVDSDVWYAALVERRQQQNLPSPTAVAKPEVPLAPDQVEYWLAAFGGGSIETDSDPIADAAPTTQPAVPGNEPTPDESGTEIGGVENGGNLSSPQREVPLFNPFPPGYAEDVDAADVKAKPMRRRRK